MARPLRINTPGLWHHVMNRGAEGQDVFRTDEDRATFLALVGECATRWGVRCHALALMPNHFHLLVQDEAGQLSRAMRHLVGVYTQRFNRSRGADGPVLRGRFRARVVQTETYLAEVVRYIHLNPVHAHLAERAGDYAWSSHRHYLDPVGRPTWLSTQAVLDRFGGDTPGGRAELDRFVHLRAPEEIAERLSGRRWGPVLGSPEFEQAWRDQLRGEPGPAVRAEVAELRAFRSYDAEAVLAAIAEHFGVTRESLMTSRRRAGNLPRAVAVLLLVDATALTQRQVAELLVMAPTSVGSLAGRLRARLPDEPELAEHIAGVRERLGGAED
jgi:REP element-mobilizing transposase RayT